MLEHIVNNANARRADQGLQALEPWQMFDMIGGTSTGGWVIPIAKCIPPIELTLTSIIAIMLGRLRMSLEQCRAAYEELSETAFTPLRSSLNIPMVGWNLWSAGATFDVKKLEDAILAVIAKNKSIGDTPKNALLHEPVSEEGTIQPCKTYVSKSGDLTPS
jgi:hypothetical protein